MGELFSRVNFEALAWSEVGKWREKVNSEQLKLFKLSYRYETLIDICRADHALRSFIAVSAGKYESSLRRCR